MFDDQFTAQEEYLVLDEATLGFHPDCGSRFFLYDLSESFLTSSLGFYTPGKGLPYSIRTYGRLFMLLAPENSHKIHR